MQTIHKLLKIWLLIIVISITYGFYDMAGATATIRPVVISPQPPGAEFLVDILVGSSTESVSDLFSLSFNLEFNRTDVLELSDANIIPGSMLGTSTIFFKMVDISNSKASIAISRKRGEGGVNGYGTIIGTKFKLSDSATSGTTIQFRITNVLAMNSSGMKIPLILNSAIVKVDTPPPCPVPVIPANNIVTANRVATFTWTATATNSSYFTYSLIVDNNSDFSSPEVNVATLTKTTYLTGTLSDGIYFWKVRATNPQGLSSKWSDIRRFTIANIPIKATFYSPQEQGSEFWVDINVGDKANPVNDLFGLSFVLASSYYPTLLNIPSGKLEKGSLLGESSLFLTDLSLPGSITIGISRKAGTTGVTGDGSVSRIKFALSPTVSPGTIIDFTIPEVTAYNSVGAVIPLLAQIATLTVNGRLEVWPGDTDNNGIVNERDIYPIAYYWNSTGTVRANASLEWKAQNANPWTPIEATYVDADGDGRIVATDVTAVGLNWGRAHTLTSRYSPAITNFSSLSSSNINHSKYIEHYREMYLILEHIQQTEGVIQLKKELAKTIDVGLKQNESLTSSLVTPSLAQNYPNPFNPETWIPFGLSAKAYVIIRIYDISGQLIRNLDVGEKEPGIYHTKDKAVYWDGLNDNGEEVASGVYFYQIHAGDFILTKQMVVLK